MRIKVKNSGTVKLKAIIDKDGDGDMFIAEATKNIPFKIKRVFFITRPTSKKPVRGNHAHKKIRQVIFCISGSFALKLDDGKTRQSIIMKNPSVGIILGTRLWHTMTKLSKDCCILVLSDGFYREDDNIRSYDKFLEYIGKKKKI